MRNPATAVTVGLLALALLVPVPVGAQVEGGTVLVLPMTQAIPRVELRTTILALDQGYSGLAVGHVVPTVLRAERERGRLGLAVGGGSLIPAGGGSALRSGWIGGVAGALKLREDPQLLWEPGIALLAGASYYRLPTLFGGAWGVADVPVGAAFSITGPLSGWLARGWWAPRGQLRVARPPGGDSRAGLGLGQGVGVAVLRTAGTGPQLGARFSGDMAWVSEPRRRVEWGAHFGLMLLIRARPTD